MPTGQGLSRDIIQRRGRGAQGMYLCTLAEEKNVLKSKSISTFDATSKKILMSAGRGSREAFVLMVVFV